MVTIQWLYLVLFLFCIKCNHAVSQTNETDLSFFDFEQMKNDIFLNSDLNIPKLAEEYDFKNINQYLKCSKEFIAIRKGLKHYELWAMKSKIYTDQFLLK